MGRTTEFISFINSDSIPDERSRMFIYNYINTDIELMEVRRKYRKQNNLKYGSSHLSKDKPKSIDDDNK